MSKTHIKTKMIITLKCGFNNTTAVQCVCVCDLTPNTDRTTDLNTDRNLTLTLLLTPTLTQTPTQTSGSNGDYDSALLFTNVQNVLLLSDFHVTKHRRISSN